MSRVIVLVLLAGCWLTAGPALAGPALAVPVVGSPTWVWPVDGPRAVGRPFAPPASRYGSGHRGADLVSTPGALVRAAGAGRVSYAGLLAGRGVVVVVHGALRTTYEPVTAAVRVGSEVAGGQALGRLESGHPACPAPACLHWGLRRGEDYLDPVRLVRAGPVRLLPPGPSDGALGLPGAAGPRADAAARSPTRAAPRRTGSEATAARLPRPTPDRQERAGPGAVVMGATLMAATALASARAR